MSANTITVSGQYLTVQFDPDNNLAQILEMDERLRRKNDCINHGKYNGISFWSDSEPAVYDYTFSFYLRGHVSKRDNTKFRCSVGFWPILEKAIVDFNTNFKFVPTSEEVIKKVNEFLRKENLPYQIDESSIVLSKV